MTEAQARERVRAFLVENFLYMRPDFAFKDDESLLKAGVVDSLGVMEIISFMEETWGIEVPQDDITEDNFGTVKGIVGYAMRRGQEAA